MGLKKGSNQASTNTGKVGWRKKGGTEESAVPKYKKKYRTRVLMHQGM